MRQVSDAYIALKNSRNSTPVHLFKFVDYDGLGSDLRLTSFDDVTYLSEDYDSYDIVFDRLSQNSRGEIDGVEITVQNVDLVFQSLVENNDFQGKKVKICTAFMEDLTAVSPVEVYFVDSIEAPDSTSINFKCTSLFDLLGITLPRRPYRRTACGWRVNSTECGLTGQVCNKTLSNCASLNNTLRNGSFPGIQTKGF